MVDRSDWNQAVNYDGDDGRTFVGNLSVGAGGWSMKRSYLYALAGIRALLDAQKAVGRPKVMLTNGAGCGIDHF